MIEIKLTKGKVAIIDEADWPIVKDHTWLAVSSGGKFYARTVVRNPDGTRTYVYMHRLLLQANGPRIRAKHIDGDTLNNRRANLAIRGAATQGLMPAEDSALDGVSWDAKRRKWKAKILIYIDYYPTKEAASAAYSAAARELGGDHSQ